MGLVAAALVREHRGIEHRADRLQRLALQRIEELQRPAADSQRQLDLAYLLEEEPGAATTLREAKILELEGQLKSLEASIRAAEASLDGGPRDWSFLEPRG